MSEANRPNWDKYFLTIADAVKERSEDPRTKHGCVLVDKKTHIQLGAGYNALPKGQTWEDLKVDPETDEKYLIIQHSEKNAISNLSSSPHFTSEGLIAYITGRPCLQCAGQLINNNVVEFVYFSGQATKVEGEREEEIYKSLTKKILKRVYDRDFKLICLEGYIVTFYCDRCHGTGRYNGYYGEEDCFLCDGEGILKKRLGYDKIDQIETDKFYRTFISNQHGKGCDCEICAWY